MKVSDFKFNLPPELIAQHPLAERDGARMLTLDRASGAVENKNFRDLPSLLREGDLLVMNNSSVIPARLFARRSGLRTQSNSPAPSGQIEVLLTQPLGENLWRTLVKPGRKVPVGERLIFSEDLEAEVTAAADFGERTLAFETRPSSPRTPLLTPRDTFPLSPRGKSPLSSRSEAEGSASPTFSLTNFFSTLDRIGHIPLPPYIHRSDAAEDRTRYQTVFADTERLGSAAAPTAGLHFTPDVLEKIRGKGVRIEHVTLHVGLGTFQPLRVETLAEIALHEEPYTLPASTANAILQTQKSGGRVIAVGTTTVRTLEHCAQIGRLEPHSGTTSIFLAPGHRFQIVNALLTNFHLPQSTLLMLVSAFASRDIVLEAYRHAVQSRYRFFSYGDCMFLS